MADPFEHEVLRTLAYQFWVERGRPLGSPEIDWQRAVQHLHASPRSKAAAPVSETEMLDSTNDN